MSEFTAPISSARFVFVHEDPLPGEAMQILLSAMRSARINNHDCAMVNIFPTSLYRPKEKAVWFYNKSPVWSKQKSAFLDDGLFYRDAAMEVLNGASPGCFVPLGAMALRTVCNLSPINSYRGSFLAASTLRGGNYPAVPSISPSSLLYSSDIGRFYIINDLKRAVRQSQQTTLIKPEINSIFRPTFETCMNVLRMLRDGRPFACDIEVLFRQVSMISYSWSATESISIPYATGGWSEQEETMLWTATAELLSDPGIRPIFFNGVFDVQFLLQNHFIHVKQPTEDPMVLYAILYPEFRKSLAVLSSLFTDFSFWKNLVRHGDISKEEG